jgi:predicted signal transduction protein with EAL and GGDEF domain
VSVVDYGDRQTLFSPRVARVAFWTGTRPPPRAPFIAGLSPHRLDLEITESVLISDTTFIDPILSELRGMGIRIALDDFGSGYCGLHYLRQFTIDKIKVDKTIIDEACTSEKTLNILRGVSKIASEIGMTVTVEGVDNQEKAELLNREKCADELQGFFFSRPVSARIAAQMLALQKRQESQQENVVSIRRPDWPAARTIGLCATSRNALAVDLLMSCSEAR